MMHHQCCCTLLRMYLEGLTEFYTELFRFQQIEDNAALLQIRTCRVAEGVSGTTVAVHTHITQSCPLILTQDVQVHSDLLVCYLCQRFGKLYRETVYHIVLKVFAGIIKLFLIG